MIKVVIFINKDIYKARATIAKALANETRLQIIDILGQKGEHCVCELTEILGVSQPTVSKHLKVLKNAGLIDFRKEGLKVTYFLRTPCVSGFFGCLDKVLQEDLKRKQQELGIN
ncbi:ArsR/SmtB family transcription factor [Halothermothrix orenii]|uniref:Regulatory protein ArsR n=1 Tax=Halothermothrix orenii (strain H 168 / OCM 544 / DSM 9562) TaxID=373903 RepID=B8CZQ5_HALOH|nr:metalloregulator ArsR/SmtB family transcription factor [Halothermothrix orenii]ACL70757.1 regulatory protein ArsR [Halothermothrix orenii H 168]